MSYFFKGDCQQVFKIGNDLLGYGKQKSDIRCMTQGYNIIGWSYYVAGNYDQAIQNFQIATQISADLVFEITAHLFLGISYILSKRLDEAAETFDNISHHIEKTNAKFIGNFAHFFFSVYSVSQGELEYGLLKAKNVTDSFLENGSMYRYASANHVLGRVYSSLAVGDNRKSISLVVKNLFFLIRNIPFASKKAVNYFDESISVAKKIGAKGILGQAYLDLGLLYKAKKRNHKALEYILEAVKIFDECNADVFQKIAKESLPTL
jgi:tetratricopeptide (TPR) repeat protein